MEKRIIRLLYRKIIDSVSRGVWEKHVYDDTYNEFLMQAQTYNQEKKYSGFGELVAHAPNAEKLHFLVSAAATGHVRQLNGRVPDIFNATGRIFLPFKNYRFEIIQSDIKDKSKHQVAINFITEPLVWHATIQQQLLVSVAGNGYNSGEEVLTELFPLQPFLSIYSLKEEV